MDSYSEKEEKTFRENLMRTLTKQDNILERIEAQVLKTNGRVNKHDWYFTAMWWALGLVGAFILYTVPTVIKFINNINRMNQQLTQIQNENNK